MVSLNSNISSGSAIIVLSQHALLKRFIFRFSCAQPEKATNAFCSSSFVAVSAQIDVATRLLCFTKIYLIKKVRCVLFFFLFCSLIFLAAKLIVFRASVMSSSKHDHFLRDRSSPRFFSLQRFENRIERERVEKESNFLVSAILPLISADKNDSLCTLCFVSFENVENVTFFTFSFLLKLFFSFTSCFAHFGF
jgi:hypothetical protein